MPPGIRRGWRPLDHKQKLDTPMEARCRATVSDSGAPAGALDGVAGDPVADATG
jgi:hypothetical protein